MKKVIESEKPVKNVDQLVSNFSGEEILSTQSMLSVRGGDGEGDGGVSIIIIPPPPPPPTGS